MTDETPQPTLSTAEGVAPPPPPTAPLPSANADVLPEPARPRWGRRLLIGFGVLVVLAGIVTGVGAYLVSDHASRYDGRMLPGTWVAGIDVGGMTKREALRAVRSVAVGPELDRQVDVVWKGRRWSTSLRELGARSNARTAVRRALAVSASATWVDRLRMRVLGEEADHSANVRTTNPTKGARAFIAELAGKVERDPVNAAIDYSSGWVEISGSKPGLKVHIDESYENLAEALGSGEPRADLSVTPVAPEVTADDFDQILLVRIGENKLYLYEDGQIAREWTVATGQPEYMTPTGIYEVTELRYMPTWVNPAPTTWGADMPASIPPGPGNPLGVRAINWSAPAIRFHGTSATYSLGYNASHGCVRMANEDVIELYDLVEVGTPIVSLVAGPLRPMYSGSAGPQAEQSTN